MLATRTSRRTRRTVRVRSGEVDVKAAGQHQCGDGDRSSSEQARAHTSRPSSASDSVGEGTGCRPWILQWLPARTKNPFVRDAGRLVAHHVPHSLLEVVLPVAVSLEVVLPSDIVIPGHVRPPFTEAPWAALSRASPREMWVRTVVREHPRISAISPSSRSS